jgi:hypothetical protein
MVFLHRVCGCAVIAVIGASACAQQTKAEWRRRFGPVLGNEAIVGHAIAGPTAWLATGGDALLQIDLDTARFSRLPIHPLEAGEHVRSLARTESGDLWTLIGPTVLAHVDGEDGRIVRRVPLQGAHVGVFGAGREIVFQSLSLHPPARALQASLPGGENRRPWSEMRTRERPFARGAVAPLNLIACGSSSGPVIPCWFPDQAALTLTDRSGASREIALDGLPAVAPETLPTSQNPAGPVRDAFVIAAGVWVLGSGTSRDHARAPRPGGWVLARYDLEGRLFRRIQLPEPARVILGAFADRCVLLAWDGTVVEVRS